MRRLSHRTPLSAGLGPRSTHQGYVPEDRAREAPIAVGPPLPVVARAVPIDEHDRLVADHPRIVTRGQRGDVAGACVELVAVRHLNPQHPGRVVLEMGRLAELGPAIALTCNDHRTRARGSAGPTVPPPNSDEIDPPFLETRSSSGLLRVLCSALIVVGIAYLL